MGVRHYIGMTYKRRVAGEGVLYAQDVVHAFYGWGFSHLRKRISMAQAQYAGGANSIQGALSCPTRRFVLRGLGGDQ